MLVIGISGHISSGKSTIAQHLVTHYGFTQVSFADALKREVASRLGQTVLTTVRQDKGWWVRYCAWLSKQGEGVTDENQLRYALWIDRIPAIRRLLQEYGTEVRRADQSDYWVKRWTESLALAPLVWAPTGRVVAPDVRFFNEARAIKTYREGYLVRVHRPGHAGDAHQSETELADHPTWDAEFNNVGDLDDLRNLIDAWCETIGLTREGPDEPTTHGDGLRSDSDVRVLPPPLGATDPGAPRREG